MIKKGLYFVQIFDCFIVKKTVFEKNDIKDFFYSSVSDMGLQNFSKILIFIVFTMPSIAFADVVETREFIDRTVRTEDIDQDEEVQKVSVVFKNGAYQESVTRKGKLIWFKKFWDDGGANYLFYNADTNTGKWSTWRIDPDHNLSNFSSGLDLRLTFDPNNPTHARQKIELQCGQHTVSISCGYIDVPKDARRGRKCNHNTLRFSGPDGKSSEPSMSDDLAYLESLRLTPVGIGCEKSENDNSENNNFAVAVEYSSCLGNGGSCTARRLFSTDGKQLSFGLTYSDDTREDERQYVEAESRLGIDPTSPFTIFYIETGE